MSKYCGNFYPPSKRVRNVAGGDPASSLACRALNIVLQQTMNPDLGWHYSSLQQHSIGLRHDILAYTAKQVSDDQPENRKRLIERVENNLLNNPLDFDLTQSIEHEFLELEENILFAEEMDNQLPEPLSVSCLLLIFQMIHYSARYQLEEAIEDELELEETTQEELREWYSVDSLKKVIVSWFERYYHPLAMRLEYQAIALTIALHNTLCDNYRALINLFKIQQDLHPDRPSLIVYQLHAWQKWKERMEIIEHTVFSFATIPLILQGTRQMNSFRVVLYLPDPMPKDPVKGEMSADEFYLRSDALSILSHAANKFGNWVLSIHSGCNWLSVFYSIYNPLKVMTSHLEDISEKMAQLAHQSYVTERTGYENTVQAKLMENIQKTRHHLCHHARILHGNVLETLHSSKAHIVALFGKKYLQMFNTSSGIQVLLRTSINKLTTHRWLYEHVIYQDLSLASDLELSWNMFRLKSFLVHLQYKYQLAIATITRFGLEDIVILPTNLLSEIDYCTKHCYEGLALLKWLWKYDSRTKAGKENTEKCMDSISLLRRKQLRYIYFTVASGCRYIHKAVCNPFIAGNPQLITQLPEVTNEQSEFYIERLRQQSECYGAAKQGLDLFNKAILPIGIEKAYNFKWIVKDGTDTILLDLTCGSNIHNYYLQLNQENVLHIPMKLSDELTEETFRFVQNEQYGASPFSDDEGAKQKFILGKLMVDGLKRCLDRVTEFYIPNIQAMDNSTRDVWLYWMREELLIHRIVSQIFGILAHQIQYYTVDRLDEDDVNGDEGHEQGESGIDDSYCLRRPFVKDMNEIERRYQFWLSLLPQPFRIDSQGNSTAGLDVYRMAGSSHWKQDLVKFSFLFEFNTRMWRLMVTGECKQTLSAVVMNQPRYEKIVMLQTALEKLISVAGVNSAWSPPMSSGAVLTNWDLFQCIIWWIEKLLEILNWQHNEISNLKMRGDSPYSRYLDYYCVVSDLLVPLFAPVIEELKTKFDIFLDADFDYLLSGLAVSTPSNNTEESNANTVASTDEELLLKIQTFFDSPMDDNLVSIGAKEAIRSFQADKVAVVNRFKQLANFHVPQMHESILKVSAGVIDSFVEKKYNKLQMLHLFY